MQSSILKMNSKAMDSMKLRKQTNGVSYLEIHISLQEISPLLLHSQLENRLKNKLIFLRLLDAILIHL